jgi:hypothetical protein
MNPDSMWPEHFGHVIGWVITGDPLMPSFGRLLATLLLDNRDRDAVMTNPIYFR